MHRIHTTCTNAIAQGRTVLVYRGVTAKSTKHVTKSDRLAMVGDVLYVDGVSAKGMTIAVKPERYRK